jgi:hypothetical protein
MRVRLSGDEREQRALGAARKEGIGFDDVTASIAREFGEPWDALKNRRGHPARSLAIVLSRRHTALTLREIGERCGGSDYAAISQAHHRMDTQLRNNARLAGIAARITKHLPMSYVESWCTREAGVNAGESPAGAIRRFSTEDRANCVAARRGGERAWSRTGRSQCTYEPHK